MKLSGLVPDSQNANKGTHRGSEVVRESLRRLGAGRSILLDKHGRIIAGNKTAQQAGKIGLDDVIVVQTDGTQLVAVQRTDLDLEKDSKARELSIADNRASELSLEWDVDVLRGLDPDIDLSAYWNPDELEELLGIEAPLPELLTDEDAVPDVPEIPVTQPGDMYRLGNHVLMCGDATNLAHVEQLMGGQLADCVWTDPPYNVAYEGKTKDRLTIENDSMDSDSFRQFLHDSFSSMFAVSRPGCAIYVAHADTEGYNFRGAFVDSGWSLRQCLVWAKNSLVLGRQDYHWMHEPILYGWKPGAAHSWYADRSQTTLLHFDRPSRNDEHPTMKPVALVQYCIANSSKRGDRVLDTFGGSGTTLIACEKSGRTAYLMEMDPRYCDVIVRRWKEATGREPERLQYVSTPEVDR
jgi:DNA modification methylase